MRFINFIVSLSGVASVVGELAQGVPSHGDLVPKLNDRANKVVSSSTSSSKSVLGTTLSTSTKTTSTKTVSTSTTAKTTSTKAATTSTTTKTTSTKISSSSTVTATSTDAASCPAKRTLEKSQLSAKTNGEWLVYENQWVTAVKIVSGDKIAVTDVSGCTAIFLWNSANIPSTFHIFCGSEDEDAKAAFADIAEMPSQVQPVHIHIAANGQAKYDRIVQLATAEFPDLDAATDFTPLLYDTASLPAGMRYRFEAVAGTRAVKETTVTASSCSRQPQT